MTFLKNITSFIPSDSKYEYVDGNFIEAQRKNRINGCTDEKGIKDVETGKILNYGPSVSASLDATEELCEERWCAIQTWIQNFRDKVRHLYSENKEWYRETLHQEKEETEE